MVRWTNKYKNARPPRYKISETQPRERPIHFPLICCYFLLRALSKRTKSAVAYFFSLEKINNQGLMEINNIAYTKEGKVLLESVDTKRCENLLHIYKSWIIYISSQHSMWEVFLAGKQSMKEKKFPLFRREYCHHILGTVYLWQMHHVCILFGFCVVRAVRRSVGQTAGRQSKIGSPPNDPNMDRSGRSDDHIRRCDPKLDRFWWVLSSNGL